MKDDPVPPADLLPATGKSGPSNLKSILGSEILLVIENAIFFPEKYNSNSLPYVGDLVFTKKSLNFYSLKPIPLPPDFSQNLADGALYGAIGGAIKRNIKIRDNIEVAIRDAIDVRLKEYGNPDWIPLFSFLCDKSAIKFSANGIKVSRDDEGDEIEFVIASLEDRTIPIIKSWPNIVSCYDNLADSHGFYIPYIGPRKLVEDPEGCRSSFSNEILNQMSENKNFMRALSLHLHLGIEKSGNDLLKVYSDFPAGFREKLVAALKSKVWEKTFTNCIFVPLLGVGFGIFCFFAVQGEVQANDVMFFTIAGSASALLSILVSLSGWRKRHAFLKSVHMLREKTVH
jgi:hypothetical protein